MAAFGPGKMKDEFTPLDSWPLKSYEEGHENFVVMNGRKYVRRSALHQHKGGYFYYTNGTSHWLRDEDSVYDNATQSWWYFRGNQWVPASSATSTGESSGTTDRDRKGEGRKK